MAAVSEQAKQRARERQKIWRQINRDRVRETNRKNNAERSARYRKRNPEKVLQSQAAYYQRNKETILSYLKTYRDSSNKHKQSNQLWARNNKGIVQSINARRRASLRQAIPTWANPKAIQQLYQKAAELTKTTGVLYVVDHIVPITNKHVCGLHWEENLRIITAQENGHKHNKLLEQLL